jgi:hypothetical protein
MTSTPMAPTRTHRFFVTAQFAGFEYVAGGGVLHGPRSLPHAKEMGTTRTACGLDATSWFKFWEQNFDQIPSGHCADCLAATGRKRPYRAVPTLLI